MDHPNGLSIFEVGTHDGTPYLVSRFLEGKALRDELKSGALPLRKATDYALTAPLKLVLNWPREFREK